MGESSQKSTGDISQREGGIKVSYSCLDGLWKWVLLMRFDEVQNEDEFERATI
jgi:hypothetical protein